jgi:hypothetical protein
MRLIIFKFLTMQNYVAWYSGNLTINGWCGSWQLVDDVDILYVKRMDLSESYEYRYRGFVGQKPTKNDIYANEYKLYSSVNRQTYPTNIINQI